MASPLVRRAATGTGLALVAAYGYTRAKFSRTTSERIHVSEPPPAGSQEFACLTEVVTGASVRQGNRVRILRNGAETFPAMLEAISSARETIDFSSYIYWPGVITERFTEAFMQKAREGLEVNMILDAYGSAKLDRSHVQRLESAGVRVAFFRPPRQYMPSRLNNRMHRRVLIVDAEVGFAGGVGIADVWTGNAEDPEHWRETHARLEGPIVRDVLGGFMESWTDSTREILAGSRLHELSRFDDGVTAQVNRSSPTSGDTAVAQLFFLAISGAQRRLWLTTAYFAAGQRFLDALCAAARRGVDVRIMVNGRQVDKEVVRRAGQRSYGQLLESGVRIFEYDRTMLHAKTLVIDEDWCNLGSSNFDHRSFALDAELNVTIHDHTLAEELATHFLDDLRFCDEIDLDRWRSRPLATRTFELAAELARQSF